MNAAGVQRHMPVGKRAKCCSRKDRTSDDSHHDRSAGGSFTVPACARPCRHSCSPPPPPPIAPFTSSFFTELHTEIAAKQARFKSQKGDDYFPEISFGEARVEGKPQNKVGTKALPFRS